MTALLVGYARCSTDEQDLTVQREGLAALGVTPERIYVDHGLTGCNRERPGLRVAIGRLPRRRHPGRHQTRPAGPIPAGCQGDRRRADHPAGPAQPRGSVYDPTDPVGRLLFNVLAMIAEFEADLIRLRTKEGMRVAKAKGRLRGKQPRLNPRQEAHLVLLLKSGNPPRPRSATCSASHGRRSTGRSDVRRPGNEPNDQAPAPSAHRAILIAPLPSINQPDPMTSEWHASVPRGHPSSGTPPTPATTARWSP